MIVSNLLLIISIIMYGFGFLILLGTKGCFSCELGVMFGLFLLFMSFLLMIILFVKSLIRGTRKQKYIYLSLIILEIILFFIVSYVDIPRLFKKDIGKEKAATIALQGCKLDKFEINIDRDDSLYYPDIVYRIQITSQKDIKKRSNALECQNLGNLVVCEWPNNLPNTNKAKSLYVEVDSSTGNIKSFGFRHETTFSGQVYDLKEPDYPPCK